MSFLLLMFGGIIGAAQTPILWGFAVDEVGWESGGAAGWMLIAVPIGTFGGVLIAMAMQHFGTSTQWNWWKIFGAWCAAVFPGFCAALLYPMLLVGMGPEYQDYRLVVFFIEYVVIWAIMFLCCRTASKKV